MGNPRFRRIDARGWRAADAGNRGWGRYRILKRAQGPLGIQPCILGVASLHRVWIWAQGQVGPTPQAIGLRPAAFSVQRAGTGGLSRQAGGRGQKRVFLRPGMGAQQDQGRQCGQ
jgi:hypothetical protein